jgi:hypothetical protein
LLIPTNSHGDSDLMPPIIPTGSRGANPRWELAGGDGGTPAVMLFQNLQQVVLRWVEFSRHFASGDFDEAVALQ